jgi:hypothetical protein
MILIQPQNGYRGPHPTEFDHDYDIDDLEWIGLDSDPLVGVGVAPSVAHASTNHATRASIGTTIAVADVPKEFNES